MRLNADINRVLRQHVKQGTLAICQRDTLRQHSAPALPKQLSTYRVKFSDAGQIPVQRGPRTREQRYTPIHFTRHGERLYIPVAAQTADLVV